MVVQVSDGQDGPDDSCPDRDSPTGSTASTSAFELTRALTESLESLGSLDVPILGHLLGWPVIGSSLVSFYGMSVETPFPMPCFPPTED
ncbi:hypothetical protein BFN03_17900 [Rhodococcus sp. WMMA185]|nr:hypothetical protein BFN03_17900 [Rhodococcus sp. WMMA185]